MASACSRVVTLTYSFIMSVSILRLGELMMAHLKKVPMDVRRGEGLVGWG